ncbi:MAG: Activator of Hsp90 ATPase 1 family protein [Bacteroidetes bacterium]|nr:MAG: Activator of Hsp90 ATPase 1 family protein [Bacteroidota bacterium]
MIKLEFTTDIEATREKVWKTLWDDSTYRQWTSVFGEGSYAVSDWKEGSKILFISPAGDGMFSTIAKCTPNEYMSFKHLGEMKGGVEQPPDEKKEQWTGSMENYTLTQRDTGTKLTVEIDVTDEYASYFKDAFPKALAKVKSISEN